MNRIMTALALSGLFVAAPAFANVSHQGRKAPVAQKASAGEKTTGSAEKANTETKGEAAPSDTAAKPAKKSKHKKAAKGAESGSTEKPAAEAPAK